MFFKNHKTVIVVCLMLVVYVGCSPALYQPTIEFANDHATLEQLTAGRKAYVDKCGSCHSLYLPQRYTKEVWIHNLDDMQERSHVNNSEKALILMYLENYPKPEMKN